jgi:hypothetical protein
MAIRQDAGAGKERTMSALEKTIERRRFRLAGNDNETIVEELDTEAHRLAANDNETVSEDELDTEGHLLARVDEDEAGVSLLRRIESEDDGDDEPMALGTRRAARR